MLKVIDDMEYYRVDFSVVAHGERAASKSACLSSHNIELGELLFWFDAKEFKEVGADQATVRASVDESFTFVAIYIDHDLYPLRPWPLIKFFGTVALSEVPCEAKAFGGRVERSGQSRCQW